MSFITTVCNVCGGTYTFGVVSTTMVGSGHVCPVKVERDKFREALQAIYGHIRIFYDVDGLTKPGSIVDEEIGQICLVIGDALGDDWRQEVPCAACGEPRSLAISDACRHCGAGGARG